MGKPLVKSWTFWLNAVTFLLAILALPEFTAVLPVAALPYIVLVSAIGNMFLRIYGSQQPITGLLK